MKLRSRLPLFTVLRLVTPSTVPVCWIVVGKDDSGGVRAYTLRSVGTGLEHRALFADVEQGIEDGLLVAEEAAVGACNG